MVRVPLQTEVHPAHLRPGGRRQHLLLLVHVHPHHLDAEVEDDCIVGGVSAGGGEDGDDVLVVAVEDVPVEVSQGDGLVSRASEANKSCSHDVRLKTIQLCHFYSNELGLWY